MDNDLQQAAGVQELINRLRDEGVAQGQNEAEALIRESRKKSMEILDQGKEEAEAIVAKARAEAEQVREHGYAALRLASRDVMLKLKESFHEEFEARVRKLVAVRLQDHSFLERLILEVARRSLPEDPKKPIELLLPAAEVSADDLRADPATLPEGSLSRFVLGLAADVLREGLTFGVSDEADAGIHIRLAEDDVEIELSDETLTALLMRFMVPRFRAILDQS